MREAFVRPRRELLARGGEAAQARLGGDASDHRGKGVAPRKRLLDRQRIGSRRGEAQFVVVAAGQLQAPARGLVAEMLSQRHRGRQAAEVEFGAHAAAREDVAEVRTQAVAQVNGGGGQFDDRQADVHPRRRPVEAMAQLHGLQAAGLPLPQRAGGVAQRAGDPDVVVEAGAVAAQATAGRHETLRADGDRERAARGVAADQRDIVRFSQFAEAVEEPVHPVRVGLGQRQRQRRPGRSRTHRRQVAEVDGQRLEADVGGRGVGGEMHAGHQRVGTPRQAHALGRLQQRGIVADAQQHVGARAGAGADTLDQRELRLQRRAPWISAARHSAAARSSTPLT